MTLTLNPEPLIPSLTLTPPQARQLYHATRDAGLGREHIKTFSRRLHWRDLASMHPRPLLSLSRSRSLVPLHLPPYLPHISQA